MSYQLKDDVGYVRPHLYSLHVILNTKQSIIHDR